METPRYTIYYGNGCPTCEEIRLEFAMNSFKWGIQYTEIEVWDNPQNAESMRAVTGKSNDAVPIVWDGESGRAWVGDADLSVWLGL